jgi:hypothetical protein
MVGIPPSPIPAPACLYAAVHNLRSVLLWNCNVDDVVNSRLHRCRVFSARSEMYPSTCAELNHGSPEHRVSMRWWHKGWEVHKTLFPCSPVRTRLLACIAVSVGLGLVVFCVEARNLFKRMQPKLPMIPSLAPVASTNALNR